MSTPAGEAPSTDDGTDDAATPSDEVTAFFAGSALGLAAYRWVAATVAGFGPYEVRVGKSQVAFRCRRGFAYLWRPGRYLSHADVEVVLSFGLARADDAPRLKEVVHPAPGVWMHHLEIRSLDELDAQVADWLREAYETRG